MPDPAAGTEHALIFVQDLEITETQMERPWITVVHRLAYHRRAKILSEEGLIVANPEIPVGWGQSKLVNWWGWTILPDGSVHEIAKADVKALFDEAASKEDAKFKVGLPNAVPGCVIDYGYTLEWMGRSAGSGTIPIQARWPIRSYRLKFVPAGPAEPRLKNANGLSIELISKRGAAIVTGTNIPPMTGESGAGLAY